MSEQLIFTLDAANALHGIIPAVAPDAPKAIITDTNVGRLLTPDIIQGLPVITIEAGEEHKNVEMLTHVWREMAAAGLTRKSATICIGGGVTTDLGGFAAATFKRGIANVNVPTTLLAQVDASVGGKTGIDLDGLKNEIGAFARPRAVIVSPQWLRTLPRTEWLSGYGEMLKHALLGGPEMVATLPDVDELMAMEPAGLLQTVEQSVEVKRRIVEADPTEQGIRAALNLGHTAGHALESLLLQRGTPIPHGAAVAYGTVTALVLSRMLRDMDGKWLYDTAHRVLRIYGPVPSACAMHPELLELMHHDKKNTTGRAVRFSLLDAPGQPALGIEVPDDEIRAALDITADLLS